MTRTGWICWAVVVAAWVGTVAYLIGNQDKPLCAPTNTNVVVRLAQGTPGAKEAGVVYLNFNGALQARDGLNTWLHQYGKC